jgi:hypothetical protein
MPDLYASLLGTPFHAVIAHAGGERAFVRFGERADDDFGLEPVVWIDQTGAAAGAQALLLDHAGAVGSFTRVRIGSEADAAATWSARDLQGVVLRKLLGAAETQCGEPIQRLVCVVPGTLDADGHAACAQAALLAGAFMIELLTPDRALFTTGESDGSHAIVEGWDDGARLTVNGTPPRTIDLTATLSRDGLRELFRREIGLATEFDAIRTAVADRFFDAWIAGRELAHGMTITLPIARGAPLCAHVPASAFTALDDALRTRLRDAFAANGIDLGAVRAIDVLGSWTKPLAAALRALSPGATVRDDRGLELDGAIRVAPPQARSARATLGVDVYASAPAARSLRAMGQGDPIQLLAAGTRLPATSISENFKSSAFIGTFQIAARSNGADEVLSTVTIPRYAERQPSSYLRAVVHADTAEYLLLELAYLYSTRRRFAFYDKAAHEEIPLADHVFRVVRG